MERCEKPKKSLEFNGEWYEGSGVNEEDTEDSVEWKCKTSMVKHK